MTTIVLLSSGEAQRLTQRIKLTAGSIRDGLFKLRNLVDEAKASNAWQVLGYPSWTAYLADALGSEPMRLSREDRQELVEYLSGEGMSTRAIAPIVGVHHDTVATDLKAGVGNPTPVPDSVAASVEPEAPGVAAEPITVDTTTGEVIEAPVTVTETVKTVTGLDGKTYPAAPTTSKPKRRALPDVARDAGWDLRKAVERLERIREDDRFSRNQDEVAAHLRAHLAYSIETCQGILDDLH